MEKHLPTSIQLTFRSRAYDYSAHFTFGINNQCHGCNSTEMARGEAIEQSARLDREERDVFTPEFDAQGDWSISERHNEAIEPSSLSEDTFGSHPQDRYVNTQSPVTRSLRGR